MQESTVRCLLGMVGTDIHNNGIRALARFLRDNGVEVVYAGEHNTVSGLADAALSEDVDVVGISSSNAAYMDYIGEILAAMRAVGVGDVPLMVGGLIHHDDEAALRDAGVAAVFAAGSTYDEILAFVRACRRPRVASA